MTHSKDSVLTSGNLVASWDRESTANSRRLHICASAAKARSTATAFPDSWPPSGVMPSKTPSASRESSARKVSPAPPNWIIDRRSSNCSKLLQRTGSELVLIERLDRLARDLMVQEAIIGDLRKRGFELVSANGAGSFAERSYAHFDASNFWCDRTVRQSDDRVQTARRTATDEGKDRALRRRRSPLGTSTAKVRCSSA